VLASTILTLLVIPTFYDVIANARDRVIKRIRKGKPPVLANTKLGETGRQPRMP